MNLDNFPFELKYTRLNFGLPNSIGKLDTRLYFDTKHWPKAGIIVVDRMDINSGYQTPTMREFITFKIKPGELCLVRGTHGSTPQAHVVGAMFELLDPINWLTPDAPNDLKEYLNNFL